MEIQVETNEDAEDNELESGESEERESTEARFRRYVTSEMCEVSDPEEWMEIHHHSDISSETPNFALRAYRGPLFLDQPASRPAGRPRTTVQLAGRPAGQDPRSSRPAGRPAKIHSPAGRPAG